MSTPPTPRVRFCPAPSGWLHVGSVRAALYNWLHARGHGGSFVFRIEDTDATRATEDSMRSMIEALEWMGLDWAMGACTPCSTTGPTPHGNSRRWSPGR